MNFIEKIFLFTLAFSFLLMGFMFALYFDVGDMVTGQISTGSSFRNAIAESAIALLDYSRRISEKSSTPGSGGSAYVDVNSDYGAPSEMKEFVKGIRQKVERSLLVQLKRDELRRLGISFKPYIEMEALNKDRRSFNAGTRRITVLVEEKEYDEAIEACMTIIAEAGPMNLYILRDVWSLMASIYYQSGRFVEGKNAALKHAAIEESILDNREKAGLPVSRMERRRIEQLKQNADKHFKMASSAGASGYEASGSSLSDNEKREARLELVNALERGEITREEFMALKAKAGL